MDTIVTNKRNKRRASAICGKQILCSREHSKLCFGQPEIFRAAQNNLQNASEVGVCSITN